MLFKFPNSDVILTEKERVAKMPLFSKPPIQSQHSDSSYNMMASKEGVARPTVFSRITSQGLAEDDYDSENCDADFSFPTQT